MCTAARLLRIPIELYELNVIPGKAISFLAPLARTIFITFAESKHFFPAKHTGKCVQKNYPLRFGGVRVAPSGAHLCEAINKRLRARAVQSQEGVACEPLLFTPERKTIFLLGGSQGSGLLNKLLRDWLLANKVFVREALQVIHQTGARSQENWEAFYCELQVPVYYFTYEQNVEPLYQLADLVICRSGAGTLFELEFFRKKALLVPLQGVAAGHQIANAQAMAARHPELFRVFENRQGDHCSCAFDQHIKAFLGYANVK